MTDEAADIAMFTVKMTIGIVFLILTAVILSGKRGSFQKHKAPLPFLLNCFPASAKTVETQHAASCCLISPWPQLYQFLLNQALCPSSTDWFILRVCGVDLSAYSGAGGLSLPVLQPEGY
jgi:hypothetical protein